MSSLWKKLKLAMRKKLGSTPQQIADVEVTPTTPFRPSFSIGEQPLPVSTSIMITPHASRRGAISINNPGKAGIFDATLNAKGKIFCKLEDVFSAILVTEYQGRGSEELPNAKVLIKMLHNPDNSSSKPLIDLIKGDLQAHDYITNIGHLGDENSWNLIASVSSLCVFPKLMVDVFRRVKPLGSTAEDNAVFERSIQSDPLLYTFALRNVLTRLAFYTKMTNVIYDVLENKMSESNYDLVEGVESKLSTFVFVGFNRLMSPNNDTGVSYSSDIDYKLIFDSSMIVNRNKMELSNEQVKGIVLALNNAQRGKDVKAKFDLDAKMLLEVEDFTTRDLRQIKDDILNDDGEQNFLASIYNNKVKIAGSGVVYNSFEEILADKENSESGLEIARRTWTQYLGKSDKGSVQWIAKTKEIKDVVTSAAEAILKLSPAEDQLEFCDSITTLTGMDPSTASDFRNSIKDKSSASLAWFSSPKIFKALLGNDKVVNKCIKNDTIVEKLKKLNMFNLDERTDDERRLKILAKVYAELGDDNVFRPSDATLCLYQIGSTLQNNDHWRFSLKYAGCRLNDFFDSVTVEDYLKWSGPGTDRKYKFGKKVASVINEFALRMQNFIYLLARIPDDKFPGSGGKSHEDIDALYSRITKQRFFEMAARSKGANRPGNVDLTTALQDLKKGITNNDEEFQKDFGWDVNVIVVHRPTTDMQNCFITLKNEIDGLLKNFTTVGQVHDEIMTPGKDGREFFSALFALTHTTAKFLNPMYK